MRYFIYKNGKNDEKPHEKDGCCGKDRSEEFSRLPSWGVLLLRQDFSSSTLKYIIQEPHS
jgi:hypothetical protein